MDLAQTKFDALVQEGTWNRPSAEQPHIIALTATLENMSKANAGMAKAGNKPKSVARKKVSFTAPRANEGDFAWKAVAPTDKSKSKVVNNKTYHWCPGHKAWTLHTAAECRRAGKESTTATSATDKSEGSNLSFSQALIGMIDDEASAADEEEEI